MSLPLLVSETRQTFKQIFGCCPVIMAHAPGRLNICGEHADYNGGLSLPMALNHYAVVGVKPADSNRIRAYAVAFDERIEWMQGHEPTDLPPWANYINGAVSQFSQDFGLTGGIDIVVHSDLSIGTGLGSSAAFGVCIAMALQILSPKKIKLTDLPAYCQGMENTYMRVETGVMDQTIAIFGRKGYALRIDFSAGTRTLEPLRMHDHQFVVMESGESRQLAKSGYNDRVTWSQSALNKSAEVLDRQLKNISAITPDDFSSLEPVLTPEEMGVVRHVVTENRRVDACAHALVKGDMVALGKILFEAHLSMRDNMQASSERLDFLVNTALEQTGCTGARLVGGGFGGSCFALVATADVPSFINSMQTAFREKYDAELPAYPIESNDAASVWRVYD